MEDAKLLFRLGNTQFKKALEYFLLDGSVTEHSKIKKDISDLYKYLLMLEQDPSWSIAMYERRYDLLKPLVTDINPNAFEQLWVELAIDLQVICHSIFDCYYSKIKSMKKMPNQSLIDTMNKAGKEAISISEKILEIITKKEEKFEYIQAVINQWLSIG